MAESPTKKQRTDEDVRKTVLAALEAEVQYLGKGGRGGGIQDMMLRPPGMPLPEFFKFKIVKVISYDRPGKYGDGMPEVGKEMLLSTTEQDEFLSKQLSHTPDGSKIQIKWNHFLVETGRSSGPKREIVQILWPLSEHAADMKYEGSKNPREGSMIQDKMYKPPGWEAPKFHCFKGASPRENEHFDPKTQTDPINKMLESLAPDTDARVSWTHYKIAYTFGSRGIDVVTKLNVKDFKGSTLLCKQEAEVEYMGCGDRRNGISDRMLRPDGAPEPEFLHFKVVKLLSYERPGEYGDAAAETGKEFGLSVIESVPYLVKVLKQRTDKGAKLRLKWVHVLESTESGSGPRREIVEILKTLSEHSLEANYEGFTNPRAGSMISDMMFRPPGYEPPKYHVFMNQDEKHAFDPKNQTEPMNQRMEGLVQGKAVKVAWNHFEYFHTGGSGGMDQITSLNEKR